MGAVTALGRAASTLLAVVAVASVPYFWAALQQTGGPDVGGWTDPAQDAAVVAGLSVSLLLAVTAVVARRLVESAPPVGFGLTAAGWVGVLVHPGLAYYRTTDAAWPGVVTALVALLVLVEVAAAATRAHDPSVHAVPS